MQIQIQIQKNSIQYSIPYQLKFNLMIQYKQYQQLYMVPQQHTIYSCPNKQMCTCSQHALRQFDASNFMLERNSTTQNVHSNNCLNNNMSNKEGINGDNGMEEGMQYINDIMHMHSPMAVSSEQYNIMQEEPSLSGQPNTIGQLIDSIQFTKKKKQSSKKIKNNNKEINENSPRSSFSSLDPQTKSVKSQQSKSWTETQDDLFFQLINKYGTDFNMIKQFFPKKSKNQIKNKYKQMANMKKKLTNYKNKGQTVKNQQISLGHQSKSQSMSIKQSQINQMRQINEDQAQNQIK